MKRLRLLIPMVALVLVLFAAIGCTTTSTPQIAKPPEVMPGFAKTDCSKLADYWKGKMLKNWAGMETQMRIIVDVRETGRSETILSCVGTARRDGGKKTPVSFTYERYPDGTYWHDIKPDF